MVPDRAGADTQVIVHIPFAQLRGMDGASALEDAWIAGRLGDSVSWWARMPRRRRVMR
jgi:hypothetical protein